MLKSIMETIRNNENYNMEELFQEYDLSDEEFGAIVNFLYTENIPEVRVSIENNDFVVIDEENADISEKETIELYLDDIKEHNIKQLKIREIDETDRDQLVNKHLKIVIRESLQYVKLGFSFLDLVQEATIGVINGIEKLKNSESDIEFWLKNFAIKYILEYQKKILKDFKASELAYILYLKVQLELNNGLSLEEISKQMNIELNYLNALQELFTKMDDMPENSYSIVEKVSHLTRKYVLSNIPKKLNYLDERILMMHYGLDDKFYKTKEISKILNIEESNINVLREKALTKLAFNLNKEQMEENMEYLN
ncbi:RNA polymerase sigma factor rpoD [Sebaldella termitidis]|jgi:RNA polymerase primary sigma factor|uniref:RNA polymerase, sigma 32 subunit, RpoH n=1 Tax=Sebaldella termitidis (strain ATCC 33386 / NCTC 11300) TaxID=526218 RepID=D1ANI1_SEBTE|nr:sigma-70 family RNA polymerase sigma factor [Sebaldella termitidis]ACZ09785.1 RNA polymerase, sigma 32 subunit, RpoH [Sebaldella termitidis ATCC 33386]SUI25116.1 RNA polymerase sigma factor rpoD [Sebaldella termitidis]